MNTHFPCPTHVCNRASPAGAPGASAGTPRTHACELTPTHRLQPHTRDISVSCSCIPEDRVCIPVSAIPTRGIPLIPTEIQHNHVYTVLPLTASETTHCQVCQSTHQVLIAWVGCQRQAPHKLLHSALHMWHTMSTLIFISGKQSGTENMVYAAMNNAPQTVRCTL